MTNGQNDKNFFFPFLEIEDAIKFAEAENLYGNEIWDWFHKKDPFLLTFSDFIGNIDHCPAPER